MKNRIEHDSLGDMEVPEKCLWGAQTQRALGNFVFAGDERMPEALLRALAMTKRACARVNGDLGLLDVSLAEAIIAAADEVLAGQHPDQFPLPVWQTGSGTQTNMNMNEVLANRASELLGGTRGTARKTHPNDHVNLGQSSNDVFPTAMHVAAVIVVAERLLPALRHLRETLAAKAAASADLVKIGRTHLQDATPLTVGQEFSGWVAQLDFAVSAIESSSEGLHALAIGGTAVGTGMNTHPEFGERVAAELARATGLPFRTAANYFAALAGHDALVSAHGALRLLASALFKIANDIRWLASGPRCGIGELRLPENEPGSSIMPGKVNPTQCESLTMICAQVFGNDLALGIGGAGGNFQLNVFKPLIARNFLHSADLLTDGIVSFDTHCARGLEPDTVRIAELVERSLMLVTALSPHIGYDRAAEIARRAHRERISLRAAAINSGFVTAADFDRWVKPAAMLGKTARSG